jgi:CRP/FNR family transcriptional regulator
LSEALVKTALSSSLPPSIPVLGDAFEKVVASVCGSPIELPVGSVLFRQGSRPETVFVIVRGVVKHVRAEAGSRETLVALRTPMSLVGSSASVADQTHLTTASTLTTCVVRTLGSQLFRSNLESNKDFSLYVHRLHAAESREQILRASQFAVCAADRLARLLRHFVKSGFTTQWGQYTRLDVPLNREEIGDMIGVRREHVSRVLSQLEAEGLVSRRDHWILIPASSPLSEALSLEPRIARRNGLS